MAVYKKIRTYVPGMGGMLFLAALLIFASSMALLAEYQRIYLFLEKILAQVHLEDLTLLASLVVLLAVAHALLYFFGLMATHAIAFRLEANLKKAGMDALLEAPFAFYDKYPSGKIRKILDDNTALTHTSVAHLLPDFAGALVMPLFGLALAFQIDWRLAVFMILTILGGALLGRGLFGESAFMGEYMQAQEEMGANAVEYIRNMGVIKIFNANVQSLKRFHDSIANYANKVLLYALSCRISYVSFQCFFNSIFLLLIPLGFWFIGRGEDPILYLTKSIFYVLFCGILFLAFMKIMYFGMHSYLASSAIEKIEKLMQEMEEGKCARGNLQEATSYAIDFHHVTFAYEEEKVLDDLTLHLESGKTYALVGSSGGGKSTLAKLLAGFYQPQEGQVQIGGHSLNDYTEEALTSMVAMVFQNAKLFKTTIFENVQMANPKASREEVLQALHLARCDDILDAFPDREETVIGSKGVHLSGGEKQRIAIARAILKNAPIIILDEASAAADPENEYEIQQAFSHLMQGKTVVMIAHRLSSIRRADEILVVEQGKILERGDHASLMAKEGRYAYLQKLYAQANDWRVVA